MDEPSQKITGAILAGGKSRRMGRNKALLELAGKPVIERLVEQFRKTFAEVIVIANDTQYGRFCDAVFSDIYYEKGPLAGLHSALTHAANDWVFISACDSPFFNVGLFREMLPLRDKADAVICETEDGLQPLTALYSRRCLPHIDNCLQQERLKVASFHDRIRLRVVPSEEIERLDSNARMFWNMNYPEDYEQALQWIEACSEV
jgi:molybdopterin-guanine dinucleotide biosynthesis protein A